MKTSIFTLLCLLLLPASLVAQQEISGEWSDAIKALRPATVATTVRIGEGQVRNTYLTPLLYEGRSYGLGMQRWRRQGSLRWLGWQQADLDFTRGVDAGDHSDEWAGRLRYRLGVLRATESGPRRPWTFAVGPYIGVDAGFDYNLKMGGSNNPATARATANAGLAMVGAYRTLQGLRVSLQMYSPLAGVALMPDYGASYYESFYLDDGVSHLLHLTLPNTQQDFDAQLALDVPLSLVPVWRRSDTVLRLGVAYHIETMSINDVTTRHSNLQLVLGWVFKYLPVNRRNSSSYNTPLHEAY